MNILALARCSGTGRLSFGLVAAASRGGLSLQQPLTAQLRTFAPVCSHVKTPIQKWGWEYLQGQKQLKRPLSPHLTVYKPMLTWMVSGLHRISGTAMGSVIAVCATTLMVAPFDFTACVEFVRALELPAVLLAALKYVIAWPIVFHTINGVRFLGFDMGKGTDIKSVYKSGWFVVGLSLVVAAAVTFWPSG